MKVDSLGGGLIALVNVGSDVMTINILKDGDPLFTREVAIGFTKYAEALQKELDLGFEDATRLEKGQAAKAATEGQEVHTTHSVAEVLVSDIRKTFDFFSHTAASRKVEKIYVSGGSARVPGFIESLQKEFKVPTAEVRPFISEITEPEADVNNAAQILDRMWRSSA